MFLLPLLRYFGYVYDPVDGLRQATFTTIQGRSLRDCLFRTGRVVFSYHLSRWRRRKKTKSELVSLRENKTINTHDVVYLCPEAMHTNILSKTIFATCLLIVVDTSIYKRLIKKKSFDWLQFFVISWLNADVGGGLMRRLLNRKLSTDRSVHNHNLFKDRVFKKSERKIRMMPLNKLPVVKIAC